MKYLLVVLMLSASVASGFTQACCCTGVGANYSILPNLNKHIIGLRYTYRSYYSQMHSLNPDENGKVTNQYLHTAEIFGRFNLHSRVMLSVFLPVNYIHQADTKNNKQSVAGLGDMSLLFQFNLLDPLKCNGKETKHQLRLGVGTKLPSGQFKISADDMFFTNLQLGTGSIDFIGNAIYTFRYKGFGLNASAGYKFNTVNAQGYRFGDKIISAFNLFYVAEIKDLQIMPLAGINFEHQFYNRKDKRELKFTGGDFLTASLGLDIYYKHFAFSANVSPGIVNRLNWYGENKNRFNVEAGLFYNFSTTNNKNKQK